MNGKPVAAAGKPAALLVIDSNLDNVALLIDLLQADHRVLAATSDRATFRSCSSPR